MSDWIQIKIRTTSKNADTIAALLEQLNALAVTYSDAEDSPILEPLPGERRLWPNTDVTGLFDKGSDAQAIVDSLKQILGDHVPIMSVNLEDRDWIRAWMDSFKPLKFGSRLWICPTWCTVPDPDAVTVMLDPGLAFGTGTHPTTSLCLEWLDSLALAGKTVLDYGCGSGILAIAALKLGADKAYGVDIDPQALEASAANAKRNGVMDKLTLCDGKKSSTGLTPAPVTVANILCGPLAELEPHIAALTAPSGLLALSGILTEQVPEIIAAYSKDFSMALTKEKDGWALITGQKK